MVDGVLLSTAGRSLIESIRMEAPKIKRHRRWGKKPEGWDDKRGEIEKKMEEIMAERRVSQDTETTMSAPIISRMLSIGSVDDDEKGIFLTSTYDFAYSGEKVCIGISLNSVFALDKISIWINIFLSSPQNMFWVLSGITLLRWFSEYPLPIVNREIRKKYQ